MENLFKINEIAKFFGIKSSAIRYYEKYGLIKPAMVDDLTKYRYYDLNNVNTLAYIIELRKSGMGMESVQKYLNEEYSRETFVNELQNKIDYLNSLIKINEVKITKRNEYIIDEICVPSKFVYTKNYTANDLPDLYAKLYEFLSLSIKKVQNINSSICFIEFDSLIPQYEKINVKIGIESKASSKDILKINSFNAIRTFHKGSYEELGKAYEELTNYAKTHKLKLKGNAYEFYHESFNLRKNPIDNLTEIILPLV